MPALVENKVIIYAETPRGGELAWRAAMQYLDWRNANPSSSPDAPDAPREYIAFGVANVAKFTVRETKTGTIIVRQEASDEDSWLWRDKG